MVEKRVKKFGQGPPPFSGNARKKSIFVMGGVPLLGVVDICNGIFVAWLDLVGSCLITITLKNLTNIKIFQPNI